MWLTVNKKIEIFKYYLFLFLLELFRPMVNSTKKMSIKYYPLAYLFYFLRSVVVIYFESRMNNSFCSYILKLIFVFHFVTLIKNEFMLSRTISIFNFYVYFPYHFFVLAVPKNRVPGQDSRFCRVRENIWKNLFSFSKSRFNALVLFRVLFFKKKIIIYYIFLSNNLISTFFVCPGSGLELQRTLTHAHQTIPLINDENVTNYISASRIYSISTIMYMQFQIFYKITAFLKLSQIQKLSYAWNKISTTY